MNKSDISQYIRHTLGTILTKFVLIFLKLGVSVITARMLGAEGRGLFYSSVQTTGLVNSIGTFSIGEGIVYQLGKGKIEKEKVLGVVCTFTVFFSLILCSLLYLSSPYLLEYFLEDISKETFNLFYFMMVFMMFEYMASSALKGRKLFKVANKLTIITRSIVLIFISTSLMLYSTEIYYTLLAYTYALAINSLLFFYALYVESDRKLKIDMNHIPSVLKYSGKVHIGTLLTEVEYRLDVFILLYFLNATAVGIYSIGVVLAQIMWYVSNSINSVLFPYLSSFSKKDREWFTIKIIKYNLLTNIIIIIALVTFGSILVRTIYGEEFINSYYVFVILSPGLLFDSIARNLSTWFKSSNKPEILSYVSLFSLFINVLLCVLLIPDWGIYGAAISSSISYIVRSVFLIYIFSYMNKVKILSMFFLSKAELGDIAKIFFLTIKKLK